MMKAKPPFVVPIRLALVDLHGRDIPGTDRVFELNEPEAELAFENLQEPPAFASINRDYSFYGTFVDQSANVETLIMQARIDPNYYCRVDAMRMLTDIERKKLLDLGETKEIDPLWLGLYGEILSDNSLPSALKAFFLRIDEQPMDRTYSAWFPELVNAREQLMLSIHNLYRQELQEQFDRLDTYALWSAETLLDGLEDRLLKNVLLELITVKDTTESHMTILDHFRRATAANDKVSALVRPQSQFSPRKARCSGGSLRPVAFEYNGICQLPSCYRQRNVQGRVRTNRKGAQQANLPDHSADLVPRAFPDHGQQ